MPQFNKPIGVIDTVTNSWRNLANNFRIYSEFTGLILAVGVTLWLLILAVRYMITDRLVANIMTGVISVPFVLIYMVLTITMIQVTWKTLSRKKVGLRESIVSATRSLVSLVWLSFLTGLFFLAIPVGVFALGFSAAALAAPLLAQHFWLYSIAVGIIAALGGIMVIVPAYFALPTYFTAVFLTIDGLKGMACLKRSIGLVRGRWWRTFWRMAVPSLFFWLTISFAIKLAYLLSGSILGNPGMFFGVGVGNGNIGVLQSTVILIISQIAYGISTPLFTGIILIVWDDLKRLEGKE